MRDDYDSPWKEAIEDFFPEFMAFYFPDTGGQKNEILTISGKKRV